MRGKLQAVFTFLLAVSNSVHAANDCDAVVTFVSAKPKGSGVEATFNVTTKCAASAGRFEYTYESSQRPGVAIPRNSPTWSAGAGKSFKWTDEVSSHGGATLSKFKVTAGSVESTKL